MSGFGQFREQLYSVDCLDSALGVLARALQDLDFGRFIVGYLDGSAQDLSGKWREYKFHTVNFPAGWEEAWDQHNPHCPYYHSCFDGQPIFDWGSVRTHRKMTEMEEKAQYYLADFGLVKGLTVPIHSAHAFGFVTIIGERNERDWTRRVEAAASPLLFLSHVYHAAVRDRFSSFLKMSEYNQISFRERECLRWAAAGKTTGEIATILGLSHETVRIYFKRAMKKLGATSRTQAVASACIAGIFGAPQSGEVGKTSRSA